MAKSSSSLSDADKTNIRKVALVTGAGAGIGEATAVRLAKDGMAIGVLDINPADAEKVASGIQALGGRAIALQADVSDRSAVIDAVAKLRAELGGPTVLVNNAAISPFLPFSEITEEDLDQVLSINLKSIFFVSQQVLPDMEAAGWGRIVNIAAYGAQLVEGYMGHYYASKGGVISLTRSMAAEFGPKGITVNSVSPGFIDTPMARYAIDSGMLANPETIYGRYPIARLGKPEEIAAACSFFASEDAGFVTAQLLGVNGGAVG